MHLQPTQLNKNLQLETCGKRSQPSGSNQIERLIGSLHNPFRLTFSGRRRTPPLASASSFVFLRAAGFRMSASRFGIFFSATILALSATFNLSPSALNALFSVNVIQPASFERAADLPSSGGSARLTNFSITAPQTSSNSESCTSSRDSYRAA